MAGKRIKGATITFEVTDDGSLRAIGQKAAGAKKGLDGVGKSSGDVRRNMQAMSGRVESGTKGFARMQQGTGGLVQAYAILASTLFAVGAAFRAMENAANIRNQIQGFTMLAEITGTSMLSITSSVRAATGGLLDFQTAAQQTAIATAAGFSKGQIIELAEGARNASVALGRDLTDSFNRLIRGVTKAEPELLDELGIILRLDIATRNFAAAQGLSADKLTIAQRRTAVFNEVAKQLDNNFGAINDKADQLLNPFTRFSTALSDIAISLSNYVIPAGEAFIGFFERNGTILSITLGFIAKSLITSMVPALGDVNAAMDNWTTNSQKKLKMLSTAYDGQKKKLKEVAKMTTKTENQVSKAFKASITKRGLTLKEFFDKDVANQKRSVRAHINALKAKEQATGRSMARQIAIQEAAYKKIAQAGQKSALTIQAAFGVAGAGIQAGVARVGMAVTGVFARIGTAALAVLAPAFATLGAIINAAFGIFMAFSIGTIFYDMIPAVKKAKEAAAELEPTFKASNTAVKEMGLIMSAFSTTKVEAIGKAFLDGKDTAMEMASAVDFLNNALNNLNLVDPTKSLIDSVESQLVEAGMEERKWYYLWLGKGPTEAAKMAGEMAANDYINSALVAMQTAEGQSAVRSSLETLFRPGDDVKIKTSGDRRGAGTFETKERAETYGRGAAREAEVNRITQERVGTIMNLVQALRSAKEEGKATTQYVEKIQEAFKEFGFAAEDAFKIITDPETGIKTVEVTDNLDTSLTKVTKTLTAMQQKIQGVANMTEPLNNLVETFNLLTPKPSEYKKLENNLKSVFNEIEGYTKKDGTIVPGIDKDSVITIADIQAVQGELTKEQKAFYDSLGGTIKLYDVAIFKIMQTTGHTKETAQALFDNRKTIIDTISAVDEMNARMNTMSSLNQAQLLLNNQLNDRHSKRNALVLQQEMKSKELLAHIGNTVVEHTNINNLESTNLETQTLKREEMIGQKEVLQAQLEVINNQLDRTFQLRKALIEAFDSAGGKGLEDMILGEKSGSEVMRAIADDMRKASAGQLSDMIMTPITGGFKKLLGMGEESIKLTPEAQAIQKVHNEHVTALRQALGDHVRSLGGTGLMGGGLGADGANTGGGLADAIGAGNLTGEGGTGSASAAANMVKSQFSSFFSSMFGPIGSLFSSLFGGLGGMGGGLMSIFGLEKGGVIGLAKGGMARYADGGVATQPTYLVGEGKKNEAVVPLPDNRSIPVNLKGQGSTNNTSINVNIDSSGSTTDITGNDAGQFGEMLNAAVQTVIEREMRPGGILGG